MDTVKGKWKKSLFLMKTWERCKSVSNKRRRKKKKSQVAPGGCFYVYVGPEKQRFVVKAELANHPTFRILLEDAKLEYGYRSDGPILLPCDVDRFYKVLAEMESCDDDDEIIRSPGCTSMISCSPSYAINKKRVVVGYGGGYGILNH